MKATSTGPRRRRPRAYGEQPRSRAGRHFIQTQVRTDVYLRVREVMERHNLSASGAVHHLLRERFSLSPLPPFDRQPATASESLSTDSSSSDFTTETTNHG